MKKTHVYPDIIHIPYDPADEINIGERKNLVEAFERQGWRYMDAMKCSHYGEDIYFWVLEKM